MKLDPTSPSLNIMLANPRGFCAGVDRAISIVERALELFSPPIYVRHEVVHNRYVVQNLKDRGAVFVEELDQVPDNNIVIFSAHGVSQAVRAEAKARGLRVFDATCPLVTKVHLQVTRASRKGIECILIGHAGHPEVEGTMGQYDNPNGGVYLIESPADVETLEVRDPNNLCFVTQTTLSVDDTLDIISALLKRFPSIEGPRKDDICYATQNRQDAVRNLSADVDLLIVVGSKNSSNSNRLRELALKTGTESYLVDTADDIDSSWFEGVTKVAVTAGASAPEVLVQQVVQAIAKLAPSVVTEVEGRKEDTVFAVPAELR
ncbi:MULTISPECIES: 4-hydroxy-3-methylbut-2-enyl diphosphate reductase [Shewanella]|jgi:4-hydroxy-3-methylbut-2-enyl diphosphate reductase|uniref:4-hydroxy-3-methylbut-2-enyl diphosphate reductase n=1 Tax=Shewanella xiamenensis TaxID=332186 RepID=A0ABT6UEQ9_9GAMM|nr:MULTISPECIES: 4-hydroxy-3-methylbut-2-enyl diphosphate reductase [Shewanella]ASF17340.1 4-hydroxy-3-methylbut-2-enyl diphosphate reductase [Shewanella sp. FDAARGOS_354]KEK27490.1 4-hydroxy-3-methylbut-2-enyl diphosphate reductase [Shewanella xiamenensis]MBW0280450.1 4-hydroxy-3-methylbut-2-enyl diphosphate reductase [Shewanella xiamenensis]MCL1069296.1 4-hydroxy-3-methylbut-2-enyl diphosphate reductase [Shewanella xiamenensis]MCR4536073.1 4-hydroxy-3-methylbut-2-enyl diphosphate reductase [